MEQNIGDVLRDEALFPYVGMSLEERNLCLEILKNCKDICDSDQKVEGIGLCKIVEMRFKKENGLINGNGSLAIGKNKKEYRTIDADISFEKNYILVNMTITRLLVEDDRKYYFVVDMFKLDNDVLKRVSRYNYNRKDIFSDLENDKVKGMLK